MTIVIDNLKKYSEYMIEYDNDALVVYVSGLDEDGFWFDIDIQDEVNDPESYAWGYHDALNEKGHYSTVSKVVYG